MIILLAELGAKPKSLRRRVAEQQFTLSAIFRDIGIAVQPDMSQNRADAPSRCAAAASVAAADFADIVIQIGPPDVMFRLQGAAQINAGASPKARGTPGETKATDDRNAILALAASKKVDGQGERPSRIPIIGETGIRLP